MQEAPSRLLRSVHPSFWRTGRARNTVGSDGDRPLSSLCHTPVCCSECGDPWGWRQGSQTPLSGWARLPSRLHPAQPQPPPTWGSWGLSMKRGQVRASVDIKFQTKSFNCPLQ